MGEIEPNKISPSTANNPVTWDEIELAESYLVSGMFEEAAELACSILTRLQESKYKDSGDEIYDMMASSAMVLVQAWRESKRTSDLLNELECYFGSVIEIPVQVVLTGACVQVSDGHPSGVRDFLGDYLAKWQFNKEKYFLCSNPNVENPDDALHSTLEVDQYLEVVEFYTLTLLGGILHDFDYAILWTEKAQLPEEARQDLLRRLQSLNSLKSSSSTSEAVSSPVAEEPESHPLLLKEFKQSDKHMMVFSTPANTSADGIKRSIWTWLRNITKRCSNSVSESNFKILYACLIFLIFYFIRKKRDSLKRIVQRRALALKQAIVDIWQLAFSYQVNPLAAVQPLPAPANRSR